MTTSQSTILKTSCADTKSWNWIIQKTLPCETVPLIVSRPIILLGSHGMCLCTVYYTVHTEFRRMFRNKVCVRSPLGENNICPGYSNKKRTGTYPNMYSTFHTVWLVLLFNPFLFIRGFSCPRSVQTLTQNYLYWISLQPPSCFLWWLWLF